MHVDFDVAVVGGGLAGLSAAYDLDQAHRTVVVLESAPTLGGRMVSKQVTAGVCVDLGGQWVGPDQYHMLALAEILGVEIFPAYSDGVTTLVWKGVRSTYDGEFPPFDGEPPPVGGRAVKDAEKLWRKIEELSTRRAAEPWKYPHAKRHDRETLAEWLDANAKTKFGRFMVTLMAHIGGSGAFEPRDVSFLHMAFTQGISPQRSHPERYLFVGCAGQVPGLLAEQLSSRVAVHCGARVQEIAQSKDGAIVTAANGTFAVRRVIVAVPPTSAREIAFTPDMDPRRRELLDNSRMGAMIKVHALYPTPFWRTADPPLNGGAAGDLETVEFVADSSPKSGVPGILTSFIAGDTAAAYSRTSPADRKDAVLADFETFFGPAARQPTHFVEKDWIRDPLGGAFTAYLLPGTWARLGRFLRPPHGHVHWAGTEVATRWSGYFDGAIRSGQEAAVAVIGSLPHSS